VSEAEPPHASGPLRLQDTVRLSADGLAKVLGDLEARVVRAVWRLGPPATARAVHEQVAREHDVAIHTIITVLNKLVDKGLLARAKHGGLLHYEARLSEEEFRAGASRRVVAPGPGAAAGAGGALMEAGGSHRSDGKTKPGLAPGFFVPTPFRRKATHVPVDIGGGGT
jgi:hypothetical protein